MPIHLLPISRRRFLSGSAATIATLSLLRSGQGEVGGESHATFAVLSDTHLMHPDSIEGFLPIKGNQKWIDRFHQNTAHLKNVLNAIAISQTKFDGVLLNGDCVNAGLATGYPLLAQLLGELSEKRLPVHLTMGNHDNRSNFQKAIPQENKKDGESKLENRHVSVVKGRLANWFLLDSLQVNKVSGQLGDDQLQWLERELDKNSDKAAFVMAHHNINLSGTDDSLSQKLMTLVPSAGKSTPLENGLEDTERFMEILLARKHVKIVFSGHMHQYRVHKIKHVHFVMLPSVGYSFQPEDAVGWMDCTIKEGGAIVRMNSLDPTHEHAGKQVELQWA